MRGSKKTSSEVNVLNKCCCIQALDDSYKLVAGV